MTAMPDGQSDAPPSQFAKPIEIDLYCLQCGYNLRGLSGDPARCPECGFSNSIEIAEIPAALIRRQLRRMESAPALAAAAFMILLCFGISIVITLWVDFNNVSNVISCEFIPFLLIAFVWFVTLDAYRGSCSAQSGWLTAICRYHVCALVMLAATIAVVILVNRVCFALLDDYSGAELYILFITIPMLLTLFQFMFRPMYRWMKRPMEQLQRQVASAVIRKEIRSEMLRSRRWGRSSKSVIQ